MAKLSRAEREAIKMEITKENIFLQRIKRYVQYGGIVCLACLALAFTFFRDGGAPKIICIILAVVSGAFTAMSYISYRNGRKHVLKNINYLDEHK
jgi:hypothetical protein